VPRRDAGAAGAAPAEPVQHRRPAGDRVGQAGQDLLRRAPADLRGRQLDRQRQPVEAAADLGDHAGLGAVRVGHGNPGARGEERHGVVRRERRHRERHLAADVERLPAGREHPLPRRGAEEAADQLRAGGQLRLAAVEDQQRAPGARRPPAAARPPGPAGGTDGSAATSTNHTPSGNARRTSAAACRASRVLPTPPAPVSVTSRDADSRPRTPASSSRRPTKVAGSAAVG
jgi:hypothetical protein